MFKQLLTGFPWCSPMFFARNFFFQFNKSLIKIAQHSNSSPQKYIKPWLCIYSLEIISPIAFETLLPSPDMLIFPKSLSHPPRASWSTSCPWPNLPYASIVILTWGLWNLHVWSDHAALPRTPTIAPELTAGVSLYSLHKLVLLS